MEYYETYNRDWSDKPKRHKKKVDKWQLVFYPTNEIKIIGSYSLCRYKKNLIAKNEQKDYRIEPYSYK